MENTIAVDAMSAVNKSVFLVFSLLFNSIFNGWYRLKS